jgi:hypothetical protein
MKVVESTCKIKHEYPIKFPVIMKSLMTGNVYLFLDTRTGVRLTNPGKSPGRDGDLERYLNDCSDVNNWEKYSGIIEISND